MERTSLKEGTMDRSACWLLLLFVVLVGIARSGEVPSPPAVRGVQIAAKRVDVSIPEQDQNYQSRMASAQILGVGPLWEVERDEGKLGRWRYLIVGRCERLIDAFIAKKQLRALGFEDAYERAFPDLVEGNFSTEVHGVTISYPLELPAEGPSPSAYRTEFANAVFAEILAARGIASEGAIREKVASLSEDDPNRGDLQAALLEQMYRNRTTLKAAIPGEAWPKSRVEEVEAGFLDILDGRYAISRVWFDQTVWNYSIFMHEIKQDRVETYRLHQALLEKYGSDAGYQARSHVMLVATLLELSNSEISYFNEVRRMAAIALTSIPPEYRKARSVIQLMSAESYFHEGKFERAVAEFNLLLASEKLTQRERIAARYMQAKAYMRLGNSEAALNAVLESLSEVPTVSNSFSWAGELKNTVYISVCQALVLAQRLERQELADELERLREQIAQVPMDLDTDEVYFPDRIFMYTDLELKARGETGALDHACICPYNKEWWFFNECAHFAQNDDCLTTQCIENIALFSYCTGNPDAPGNPTGAKDCPATGTTVNTLYAMQWLQMKADGSAIPGCPNNTGWRIYKSPITCQVTPIIYRCQTGECGGDGYIVVDPNAPRERWANLPDCS